MRHKIHWNSEIQTVHSIPSRIPDLVIIKTDNLSYCELCRSGGPQRENQRKQKERQVLILCRRTKKVVEHEGNDDNNCKWRTWNGPDKEAGRVGNRKTSRDHPNCSIVDIGQNADDKDLKHKRMEELEIRGRIETN